MKPVIICIDDEKVVLDSLRFQLESKFGSEYDLEYAQSADEALEIIDELQEEKTEIPVIITDHVMPDISGLELIPILQKKCPTSKKILLTGQIGQEDEEEENEDYFLFGTIAKPWSIQSLNNTIQSACNCYFEELSQLHVLK